MEEAKTIGMVFTIIGAILAIVGIIKTLRFIIIRIFGGKVKGILVNYKVDKVTNDKHHGYDIVYASIYEYEVNGTKYSICDKIYNSIKAPLGTIKKIYYMKGNPSKAIVKGSETGIRIILGGILFVAIGMIIMP